MMDNDASAASASATAPASAPGNRVALSQTTAGNGHTLPRQQAQSHPAADHCHYYVWRSSSVCMKVTALDHGWGGGTWKHRVIAGAARAAATSPPQRAACCTLWRLTSAGTAGSPSSVAFFSPSAPASGMGWSAGACREHPPTHTHACCPPCAQIVTRVFPPQLMHMNGAHMKTMPPLLAP